MKNHRVISYSCAALAAVLLAFPVAAQAGSSTLSGYGGPGEGNQAVLGSALVGGHRGGGGSGGGSGGQGSSSGEASATSAPAVQPGASPGQAAQGTGQARSSSGGSGSGSGGAGSGNAQPSSRSQTTRRGTQAQPATTPRSYYPAAEHVPAGGQGTVLGLTADDLLYVILALVILVLVGLFTRRLDDSASSARTRG
jgi:hypothetical protein